MFPASINPDRGRGVSSVRAQYFRFASAVVAVVTLVTVGGANQLPTRGGLMHQMTEAREDSAAVGTRGPVIAAGHKF
jgi:hypothetical protein